MSTKHENLEFPAKRPIKKMGEVIDAGEIQNIQLTTRDGEILADLPVRANPGKIIPGVFKIPAQALGVGVSTVARLLRLGIVFKTRTDGQEGDDG